MVLSDLICLSTTYPQKKCCEFESKFGMMKFPREKLFKEVSLTKPTGRS
jgi:hypothetical protein